MTVLAMLLPNHDLKSQWGRKNCLPFLCTEDITWPFHGMKGNRSSSSRLIRKWTVSQRKHVYPNISEYDSFLDKVTFKNRNNFVQVYKYIASVENCMSLIAPEMYGFHSANVCMYGRSVYHPQEFIALLY